MKTIKIFLIIIGGLLVFLVGTAFAPKIVSWNCPPGWTDNNGCIPPPIPTTVVPTSPTVTVTEKAHSQCMYVKTKMLTAKSYKTYKHFKAVWEKNLLACSRTRAGDDFIRNKHGYRVSARGQR